MNAAEEAKQLDSVTDHVQEQELDASKAKEAMSALAKGPPVSSMEDSAGKAKAAVSKDDVALIVSELEVSEDVAERALREVGSKAEGGKSVVAEALRQLVVQ
mmetsp:Transcript_46490/g.68731  ORF Transcript_46490/g.68731 Transcript_46490/m.68731 type:complete len:102 (+) Transcript_46490:39-344(+)|eukprot:CAMPEP_0195518134 /NCGR_PEP_ID=MMETSP0794_2-20130614/12323_1 /TAXON_ID=515487 /ORGANISM="Stephanopyxis turris, Strain CCMP 815" /LENGTH=101 /DNA_ID=CAMNT_0040647053 /DNA_START=39 /DNA_END=344 /DNA_ORIENTATION=-